VLLRWYEQIAQRQQQRRAMGHMEEGQIVGGIVVCAVLALLVGTAAVATPHWHVTDNAFSHVRRGLFTVCAAESIDGYYEETCRPLSTVAFCGHTAAAVRARVVLPAVFAVASLVLQLLLIVLAVSSWFKFKVRARGLMLLAFLSAALIATAMAIVVHTYDAWYFCDKEFCEYGRDELGNTQLCLSTLGFSFYLVTAYLMLALTVMGLCALYVRAVRYGVIVERVREEDSDDEGAGGGGGARGMSRAPTRSRMGRAMHAGPDGSDAPTDAAEDTGAAVDDWVFDAKCAMYWSPSELIFYHPVRHEYYDPQRAQWWDSDKEEWR
jgi:hypothetical protein